MTVRIHPDLNKRIRQRVKVTGETLSGLASAAFTEYLERHDAPTEEEKGR